MTETACTVSAGVRNFSCAMMQQTPFCFTELSVRILACAVYRVPRAQFIINSIHIVVYICMKPSHFCLRKSPRIANYVSCALSFLHINAFWMFEIIWMFFPHGFCVFNRISQIDDFLHFLFRAHRMITTHV